MNTKAKAKKTFRYELLGTVPLETDKDISTSKLPNSRQVLLCYLAHIKDHPSRVAANLTAEKVIHIYNKARIPALAFHKVTEEILKTHKTLLKIGKIAKQRRHCEKESEKVSTFKEDLTKTFKAWPRDCLERIEKHEDREFFKSMLSDRQAYMSGIDKNLSKQEANIRKRKQEEEKRKEKASCVEDEFASQAELLSSEESDVECVNVKSEKSEGPSHKRVKYVGTSVIIPPDIMSRPAFVAAATRINISPTQQAALTEIIIKESGGNVESVKTSYAVAAKARRSISESSFEEVKKSRIVPTAACLH